MSQPVRMRHDLAEDELLIPAGLSYSDYDDLHHDFYLSAEEMEGAETYDNGEDTDNHAFNVIKLKDGRIVYMIGMDLEWLHEGEWV